jgi:hypothetical protein
MPVPPTQLGWYLQHFGLWVWLILRKWALSASASLSAIWGLVREIRCESGGAYWWFAGLIFLLAIFLVWCDMLWEARPYEKRTYESKRQTFAALPEAAKVALEKMVVERGLPISDPTFPLTELAPTGFVEYDDRMAQVRVRPDFDKIVIKLVREWRSGGKKQPGWLQTILGWCGRAGPLKS